MRKNWVYCYVRQYRECFPHLSLRSSLGSNPRDLRWEAWSSRVEDTWWSFLAFFSSFFSSFFIWRRSCFSFSDWEWGGDRGDIRGREHYKRLVKRNRGLCYFCRWFDASCHQGEEKCHSQCFSRNVGKRMDWKPTLWETSNLLMHTVCTCMTTWLPYAGLRAAPLEELLGFITAAVEERSCLVGSLAVS